MEITPGAHHFPGCLPVDRQIALVAQCRALVDGAIPAYVPVVRGGGRKRRLRVELPAVLAIVAGPNGLPAPSDRTGNPSEVELLTLADPEATVVRRRTELLGKPEPASRGTEEVTSASALISLLTR